MTRPSGYRQPGNWKSLKAAVLKRDEHTCYICQGDATTVDHIVPVGQGGNHNRDNLAAVCSPCHDTKTQAEAKAGRGRRPRVGRARQAEAHPGAR